MNEQKKAAPRERRNQTIQLKELNRNCTKANRVAESCIDELLDRLPPRAKQARRFVKFIGSNPCATTAQCNVAALAVNLSDLRLKYNPYLSPEGYEIACGLPGRPILNRLGEPTAQHLYWLRQLS